MKKVLRAVLVSFVFSFIATAIMAQGKTLTGKVLASDTGEPIPIASVLVKGYNNQGTYTDDNGKFVLNNVPADATHLIFNSMGYSNLEIPIGNQTVFNVKLSPDAIALNDVVVTALGIQRQAKEIGYATAKVTSEDLTATKNMDATQALIGKVSGLQISLTSSTLDATVRVNLRGSRSFKGDNQALLVVDGIPTPLDYLRTMNPNDMENVTVLKGGSAAALYGSAAANGVLYVTTKKGERGKPRVTYSLTTTFDKMAYFPQYQTRFGAGAENSTTGFPYYIAGENQQYGPEFDGSEVPIGDPIFDPNNPDGKQLMGIYSAKKNARESFYQTGIGLQNDISFASGGEDGSFFLSYQHAKTTGILVGDESRRQTIRFNASKTYRKKLKVGANVSYSNYKTNLNRESSDGIDNLLNIPADIKISDYKDWRNVEGGNPNDWINTYYLNPYTLNDLLRRENRSDRISASADVEYKPLPWLKFQGRAGMNIGVSNGNNKNYAWHYSEFAQKSPRSYTSSDRYSYLNTSSNYSQRLNIDAMAFAEHKFNDKFQIKGMFGWSMGDNFSEAKSITAEKLQIDDLFNLANKIGELTGSNSWTQNRKQSVYASVDFSAFGWAYLQVTGRNDWTSLLDKNNWSFFYPGANLSVMLSDAIPTMKGKWISYLKLRGTYAKVGSVNIGTYDLDNLANVHGNFPFGPLTAYNLSYNIRNRDIKPEFTTEFEVGAEIGLLKDRIVLEAAYYHQRTTNQTVNVSIPYSTGFATNYINAGTMIGQGVELDLRLTPLIQAGDFRWNVSANATFSKTVVDEIYGDLTELAISDPIWAIQGENYPMIKATDFVRSPDGRVVVNPVTGLPQAGDTKMMGTTEPKLRIGLSTVLRWKGISLSATFDYRGGHVTRFGIERNMLFSGTSLTSAVSGRQRFVFPNSVLEVKDANGNVSYVENTNITVSAGGKDFWTNAYYQNRAAQVVSAASWRLRELSLNYDLPERILDKTHFFQRISVGLVGRNLCMWVPSTNTWGDPDFTTGGSNGPGVAGVGASGTRTFGFNVTMSF